MRAVGTNTPRKDGPEKVAGTAKYIDDIDIPGCWHGATCRSTISRGEIKSVRFDPKFPWDECVVVTAEDIPGENCNTLFDKDQPLLAHTRVMHPAEPIVLVAHPTREGAYEALRHIRIDYAEFDPVLTVEDSIKVTRLLYGSDNVLKKFALEKGDVAKGFTEADFIVEGVYRVGHQEHAYIENNGVAAHFEDDGTLVIRGSIQCPYFIHKAMKPVFRLPDEKIRVIQTVTGGAFGGKEEYPNMNAGHAALLARKAKRPVKIIYDRTEDMQATTKRHPAVVRHKTGVKRDGRLTAQEIDVVMDGGAYVTISPVVLSRGFLHSTGPYECPNVRAKARAMATNSPPNGAFRGFGAPQTLFAAELHMDRIAEKIGMDALSLRRKNLIKQGSVMATGQILRESVGASKVLERTVKRSGYLRKRKAHSAWNRRRKNPTWRGIGLSVVHHGAGFTGSGEVFLASVAGAAVTRDGEPVVKVANVEMGQGAATTLASILADTLGVPVEWVRVETPDTAKVPNSGPTVASRTAMVVGGLVRRAGLDLKDALSSQTGVFPKTRAALRKAAAALCGEAPERMFTAKYQKPEWIQWDDETYKGDAYGVYGYACAVADLEVDKITYEVKVNKLYTAHDVGKAIHPQIVEGQIIGGVQQGLGYALLEKAVYERGLMQNAQLTNYVIPTAVDSPPFEVEIVEEPYSMGPFGVKGMGELPMDVPAAAVAAAVRQAVGSWFTDLPIMPEKIAEALEDRGD